MRYDNKRGVFASFGMAVYGLQAVTGIRGTRDLRGDEVGLGRRTAIDDDRRIMMISNA